MPRSGSLDIQISGTVHGIDYMRIKRFQKNS
jgi:hypothetical protein